LVTGEVPTAAVILAAGTGTRLRPLIPTLPKVMVPVAGKPVLAHAVEHLRRHGVTTIGINLHYRPDVVRGYFNDGSAWGVAITYSMEETLLGTAGAVRRMAEHLTAPFFVWYGDNISTCRLDRLYAFHRATRGIASIALFHRADPTASGVAELDPTGRITRFVEKPKPEETSSRWVNAGIYVLEPEALDHIPLTEPSDFGRDIFPSLLRAARPVYGYCMGPDEGLWWIDTPEDLARADVALKGRDR
jgi:mannose-1-phosphate guanylyltransferase/phosphomannomutase